MNPMPDELATAVWAVCENSRRQVRAGWSTRDVIVHAIESFAESYDAVFGFHLHAPNDVQDLARWIGQHLEAAGHLTAREHHRSISK